MDNENDLEPNEPVAAAAAVRRIATDEGDSAPDEAADQLDEQPAGEDNDHDAEGADPEADLSENKWCFQCAKEYVAGTPTCPECGVGLVAERPMPATEVGTEDDEQLAYELHEWAFESRRQVDQVLTADGVEHAWQGAVLIVKAADEAIVDTVIEQIERSTLPTLDPDAPKEVYEMAGWDSEQQSELSSRLGLAGLAHEFDASGDLVVLQEDEEAVEAIFDAVLDAIEEGGEDESNLEPLEGLEANKLMSAVFDAAKRLAKDPHDYKGVEALTEHGARVRASKRPFGFDSQTWGGIRTQIEELQGEFEHQGDEEEITERAAALRDTLRELI